MDAAFIVPILALITLLAGTVFALWSKRETDRALHDPKDPNSTLAANGPKHH